MSINQKYIQVIEDYQANANFSVSQAREIVEAFGGEVPFPSEEVTPPVTKTYFFFHNYLYTVTGIKFRLNNYILL